MSHANFMLRFALLRHFVPVVLVFLVSFLVSVSFLSWGSAQHGTVLEGVERELGHLEAVLLEAFSTSCRRCSIHDPVQHQRFVPRTES